MQKHISFEIFRHTGLVKNCQEHLIIIAIILIVVTVVVMVVIFLKYLFFLTQLKMVLIMCYIIIIALLLLFGWLVVCNNWKGQQNRTGMESSEGKLYFLSQLSTFCVLKGVKGRLDVQFNWLWRPRLLTERTSSYRVSSFPKRWFSFSQLFRKYDSSSFDRLFNNDLSIIGGWWFWHLRWDFKMNQESIFSSYADKRIKCILISMITASSVIMFVLIIMVIIIMISRHQYHDQHDHPALWSSHKRWF